MSPSQNDFAAARRILSGAQTIATFSGAGLSAESGVPTFRGGAGEEGGGLWARFDPMTLASPQGFARDPELVIEWYRWRRRLIAAAAPNAAHRALAARSEMAHVTQNVDDLLHRAGARHVIQLHGTIAIDRCHDACGHEEAIDLADPPGLRRCACGASMRPGVVWFGEALPQHAWTEAERLCSECNALLVIGTSAVVYPAAGLISMAKSAGAKVILVNTCASEASSLADVELIGPAGDVVPKLLDG